MAVGEAIAQLPEDFQQVNLLRMDGHDGDIIPTQCSGPNAPGSESFAPLGCACIAFSMGSRAMSMNPGQEEPFPHGCACIAFSMGAERCQGTQDGKNRSHTGVMVRTKRYERPSIRDRILKGPCRPPRLLGARGRYRTWTTHP